MMGVTKFMQNERFIQCPLSLIWSVIFVQDSRSTLQYSLEIVSFLYSWHVMEDIWVQLSVQRWEAWPGLPCLAWRATILRYLSLDAPGHVIFLPGRWIECRAQLQIMKPVFWPSCDSAWSAGAPIALVSLTYYAKFTHMNHFRKVIDCEEAGLSLHCIDSLFLWKS